MHPRETNVRRPPPLRVAVVASSLRLGGAEKQTFYAARALTQAGVEVRLFYLGTGGYYEPLLRRAGITVQPIFFPNRRWTILRGLVAAFRRWRPAVVLVSQFGDLLYGGLAGRLCRALVVGGVRSDGFYELRSHGLLSGPMLSFTHGLIANSCRARRNLLQRGVTHRRIAVLPNVIDLADFDRRAILPVPVALPPGRLIAVAVGSLHPCKRLDRFVEAVAIARRQTPALAGVIAGADHGAQAALRAQAHRLGLAPPDLCFTGECTEVPALLARAGCLVLCSDYEGFPNVLLEAMAARLPVVTTPAGDAAVVARDGLTGYVVTSQDPDDLAAPLVRLAQSTPLRTAFGEAGRNRVERAYSYATLARRLLGVLGGLAQINRRPGLSDRLTEVLRPRDPQSLSPRWVMDGQLA